MTISGSGVAPVSQNGVASLEGSRVSEGFGDPEGSLAAAGGWSLGDVLVHMGAQQGQYLTHIIMVRAVVCLVDCSRASCVAAAVF